MIHIENFSNANFYCVVLVLMGFLNNLKFSNMKFRYINYIIFKYYFKYCIYDIGYKKRSKET